MVASLSAFLVNKTLSAWLVYLLQPQIRTSLRRRGFAAIKYIFCGPPRLNEDLVLDRNLAFCMAACQFQFHILETHSHRCQHYRFRAGNSAFRVPSRFSTFQ